MLDASCNRRINIPLLHHLQRGTKNGAAEIGLSLPKRTLEAVGPSRKPVGRWDNAAFILLICDDLSEFHLNVFGVDGLATKSAKRIASSLKLALLDKVTWRVRKEHQSTPQNDSPGELDANRECGMRTVVGSVLGGVVRHKRRAEYRW
jgi:hypothetical protein